MGVPKRKDPPRKLRLASLPRGDSQESNSIEGAGPSLTISRERPQTAETRTSVAD